MQKIFNSNNLSTKFKQSYHENKTSPTFMLVEILLLVSVALPWIAVEPVALTANLYDLAEWMTLHPAGRSMGQWLPLSLALRLILVLLGWICFAKCHLQNTLHWRLFGDVIVVLLVLPIAPPIEALRNNLSDWNYRQQLLLLIVYVIGILLLMKYQPGYRFGMVAHMLLLPLGLWGGMGGQELMSRLALDFRLGTGFILFVMIASVAILLEGTRRQVI